MKFYFCLLGLVLTYISADRASAQTPTKAPSIEDLIATPAVSGHEQRLLQIIKQQLKGGSPRTDNLGNVFVTLGSGSPHRVIVTPVDEAGYVVSGITPDGYLRVQRLPQAPPNAVFDILQSAQPVWVISRTGKKVNGVFAGLSVHLQPLRRDAPKLNHPDEMYLDIGASSAQEVRAAGIDLLDSVVLNRADYLIGSNEHSAPAIGDHFGAIVLTNLFRQLSRSNAKIEGSLTIAFVTQQWAGGRGLDRLINELHPTEMVYVGRLQAARRATQGETPAVPTPAMPGSGILLAAADAAAPLSALAANLKKIADDNHVPLTVQTAASPRMTSYAKGTSLPEQFAQLGVPTLFPVTPAETISDLDTEKLENVLYSYATSTPRTEDHSPTRISKTESHSRDSESVIGKLIDSYGPSGHEEEVRSTVKSLLPAWAKPETDEAGNLILHFAGSSSSANTKKIVFMAHMDEIGFVVRSIEPDGHLEVDSDGGGYSEFFWGHAIRIHTANGAVGGVLGLPDGWEKPNFEWPRGPRGIEEPAKVYVGTHSAEETEKLGIKAGDWMTIPKEYRPLYGNRANGRSFDDRVGCAALVEAARVLGPSLAGRDVTFVWSTQEEIGLKGAAVYAEHVAAAGKVPDFVFAIDTFVSSDSPIESKRFADAQLGKGFVIRAVDNSNIAPLEYVDRVIKLARENHIPIQYGVTGGGNDGAVFPRYGSVDIPLSWPLRYSHSPGEVIDTRDLDALAKIVAVLSKNW
jgi:putative aminopeptidase FrvX